VTYTPISSYTGEDSFQYTLIQGDNTSTANVNLIIGKPITLSSDPLNIDENTRIIGIYRTEDDLGNSLTYTLSGDDAGKLDISSEGALTLLESADYETQSSYNVIISASDGSETVSESVTVGVSNIIETPPSLTLPSTISVAENTSVVAQASATDPEGSAVTYALSGTDAATFYVSSSGLVSFRAVPDYESLTKTQYSLTVTVTNAGALSASGSMTVNVTDISENFFDTCRFGDCRFE